MIVASLKGLYLSTTEGQVMTYYNYTNGFTGIAALKSNMAEDRHGNVYMLTLEHIVRFNPRELIYKLSTPLLSLQSAQISTDNINWTVRAEDQLDFGYQNKNIKFNYIGICYSANGHIFYQYRLKGFQDEWSQPQLSNEVVFNNLPPGNYRFELKANTGQPETETPVIGVPFTIHPAFWQTTWFIVVAILTLMLGSAAVAIYVQQRRNKQLMEKLDTEKQLNELRIKSIRLKAIPHFNANVLAAIEYYIINYTP
jgi:hypothetical protein